MAAPPDAASIGFVPLHLSSADLRAGAPAVILNGPTIPPVIDTTVLTIDNATNAFLVRQEQVAVFYVNSLSAPNGLMIQGDLPLIIVANQDVTISGAVELAGRGSQSGPGAAISTGLAAGGPGGAIALDVGFESAGGGGGSYGSAGQRGGSDSQALPGQGGQVYGASPTDPLMGGGPGGVGGKATDNGGGGGGALQISAGVSISITSGYINASGGGGQAGSGFSAGGGGGAGGEIVLEAPAISANAIVVANGGGGGAGGADGAVPVPYAPNGVDGELSTQPAAGGVGATHGANGGSGAAMQQGQVIAATQGSDAQKDGGGGGGGLGRIWLRYRMTSPPVLGINAVFSPSPALDPSLP